MQFFFFSFAVEMSILEIYFSSPSLSHLTLVLLLYHPQKNRFMGRSCSPSDVPTVRALPVSEESRGRFEEEEKKHRWTREKNLSHPQMEKNKKTAQLLRTFLQLLPRLPELQRPPRSRGPVGLRALCHLHHGQRAGPLRDDYWVRRRHEREVAAGHQRREAERC